MVEHTRDSHNTKRLSLYPMKVEDALRAILKVSPPPKGKPPATEKPDTKPTPS